MQFLEPCERGVKVCFVEDFAAVAQIAFEREERDLPPLGFKVVLRGPAYAWVTTAPTSFSRCTDSMNMWSSGVRSHEARTYAVKPSAFNVVRSRWSIIEESGVIGKFRVGWPRHYPVR